MSYSLEQISNNPWLLLQDLMGNADKWPVYLRKMFWDKDFTMIKRLKVTNFCYQNGISEEVLHDVLQFTLKEAYTKERRRDIAARYRYFNDPVEGYSRRKAAYALDLYQNKVVDLNGNPR